MDTKYGTGGIAMTQFTGARNETDPVQPLVLPDGKIVVAVSTSAYTAGAGGASEFGLVEYNRDGSLNSRFGDSGRVTADFGLPVGKQSNYPTGLALEWVAGTPKIVVVGGVIPTGGYNLELGVARFNLDGSPDTSFGAGGTVIINPGEELSPNGVAIEPDGDIVVVGTAGNFVNYNSDFAVVRLRPDGSLDPSFGSGGIVTTDFSPSGSPGTIQASAYSLVIQPDGRILVAGDVNIEQGGYLGLEYYEQARYDSHGQLDPTFGSGGTDIVSLPGVNIDSNSDVSVALQGDGKIVVAGSAIGPGFSMFNTTDEFAIVRLTSQGSLDTSFGSGGLVITNLTPPGAPSPSDTHATGLVIQPDGKIVVGGWTENAGSANPEYSYLSPTLLLVRYEPDGSLDPSFGSAGSAITGLVGTAGTGPTMQPDGKFLMSYTANANPFGGTNLGVARFLGMDLAISGPSTGARETSLTFTGTFDGQATDAIVGALWLFGDGSFALDPGGPGGTMRRANHAYDRPGTYTIRLFVLFPSGGLLVTSYPITITGHEHGGDPDATGSGVQDGTGAIDAAIASILDGLGPGRSSLSDDLATRQDGAFCNPATGPGAEALDQELAVTLLFDGPSAGYPINVADERPAAKAKRLSMA